MQRNYRRYAPPHLFPYSPYRSIYTSQHGHITSRIEIDILLNVLLDICRIQHAPSLGCRDDLTHQFCMGNGLPALHDPNNSRLRLEIAICSDALMGLLILLFRLFGLDLVDLDAVPWMGEVEIRGKSVGFVDIFTSRLFVENAVLGAGKGLESPFELGVV